VAALRFARRVQLLAQGGAFGGLLVDDIQEYSSVIFAGQFSITEVSPPYAFNVLIGYVHVSFSLSCYNRLAGALTHPGAVAALA
jgi:hypothetical protein